ncbi:MAG TPA: ABC transporter permease [Chitinispirillaceae bacterium]|nr:ABC transporter permease [Chitinispirillaceae bacterium]
MKRFFIQMKGFYRLSFLGLLNFVRYPFYGKDVLVQMTNAGPETFWITVISMFVIGMALSIQILNQFEGLGLESEAGKVIGISIIREVSPITLGLIFAGRVGAGISAELAGMIQRQQIDTLQAFGVNPIKKLVTPRIASSLVMLPALTFIGDFVAVIGGFLITSYEYHSDPALYWSSIREILTVKNTVFGLSKPVVFGFLIAVVSCYVGLSSKGGISGLKLSATRSFVISSMLIFITDFLITKIIWAFIP